MPNKKGTNASPSRSAYWANGKLEAHKVAHLVRFNGMTKEAATMFWRSVRRTRMFTKKKVGA